MYGSVLRRISRITAAAAGRRVARRWSRIAAAALGLAVVAYGAVPEAAAQQRGLRVFISADMEGVAGAVTPEQLGPGGFEYGRFREFMTAEVLAAIEGARAAGATEFVVADAHGNGQNLLIERFPPDVRIIRSWPRPLQMMGGIDSTFDAVFFIGYHASATAHEGVRAHTFSSARLTDVRLNGRSVSEGVFNAAIAGHYGVPVALVAGDDVTVAEVRAAVGEVEEAVVKEALGFHAANTLTPEAAQALIRERARRAIERLGEFRPYRVQSPISVDVAFKNYRPVEVLEYLPLPGMERPEARTIRYTARTMPEISRFVIFILNYEPGLSP